MKSENNSVCFAYIYSYFSTFYFGIKLHGIRIFEISNAIQIHTSV